MGVYYKVKYSWYDQSRYGLSCYLTTPERDYDSDYGTDDDYKPYIAFSNIRQFYREHTYYGFFGKKTEYTTAYDSVPLICEEKNGKLYDVITNTEFGLSGKTNNEPIVLETSEQVSEKELLRILKQLSNFDIERYKNEMKEFIKYYKSKVNNKINEEINEHNELEKELRRVRKVETTSKPRPNRPQPRKQQPTKESQLIRKPRRRR